MGVRVICHGIARGDLALCVRRPLSERLACLGKPVSDTCVVLVVLLDNSPLRLMRTLGERPPGPRIELGGSGLRRGGREPCGELGWD